jgi:hypothetical protein
MTIAKLTLGGIPIEAEKGAPAQSYAPLGDGVIRRRSKGAGVKFRHWNRKMAITVSGSGLLPPGLSGLDYDQPLELLCTKPLSVSTSSPSVTLTSDIRPDQPAWAFAYVGERWQPCEVTVVDLVATFTSVPGATRYQVCWMPKFMVLMSAPDEAMDRSHDWSFTAEEA